MIKTFLILINFSIILVASQQKILVVADDFNTSKAKLECYEDGKKVFETINVNLGKKGLGWGLGEIELPRNSLDPIKFEGDKKAPIGVFKLSLIFGLQKSNKFNMKYIQTSKNLICVDDSESINYNKIVYMKQEQPKSFEYMKRDDEQYDLGIVVEHNKKGVKRRGSCIFIHVQKENDLGTAGCTSMKLEALKKIANWLDAKKNPILIQIPKRYSKEVLKHFPELNRSELLEKDLKD